MGELPTGWRRVKLGEALSVSHGYAFRSAGFVAPSDGLPTVVKPGMFREHGGFDLSYGRIQAYDGAYPDSFELCAGDLVVVMTCQTQGGEILGVPARVPDDGRVYLHNQRIGHVEASERLDADFAYWLLSDWAVRRQLVNSATGSTVLHTSPTKIEECHVVLPPRAEQERIADLLQALDDKIESNHRLIRVAEQTLSIQFDRWREQTGGHEVALPSVARFVNGRNFTKGASGDGRIVLRIKELTSGVSGTTVRSDVSAPREHVARDGDLLFAWSGSLGVHRWYGDEALVNQHIFNVLPDEQPLWWVEQWLRVHLNRFVGIAADKAVTMGHIRRGDLDTAMVTLPTETEARELRAACDPLDDMRKTLHKESRTLSAIRDALLPKLVSGQIRVPLTDDVEEQVGAATEALVTA